MVEYSERKSSIAPIQSVPRADQVPQTISPTLDHRAAASPLPPTSPGAAAVLPERPLPQPPATSRLPDASPAVAVTVPLPEKTEVPPQVIHEKVPLPAAASQPQHPDQSSHISQPPTTGEQIGREEKPAATIAESIIVVSASSVGKTIDSSTPHIQVGERQPGVSAREDASPRKELGENEITRAILSEFSPESGIKIEFHPDNQPEKQFFIHAPTTEKTVKDEHAIAWGVADGMSPELFEGRDREENLKAAHYQMSREFIRSTGITSRNMEETMFAFPQLDTLLRYAQGKTVVLGSGFGELPIYLAELYARGELAARPVIDDLFDYKIIEKDFTALQRKFAEEGLAFPFSLQLSRIKCINDAIDSGNLEAVQHTVGTGNSPPQLMDAALITNIYGPVPLDTLQEQLSMLAPGGSLLVADNLLQHREDGWPEKITSLPGFDIEQVVWLNKVHHTSKITKRRDALPIPQPRRGTTLDSKDDLCHNTIAEMVINSVEEFEVLNAPTLEDAEEKFTEAVIKILQHSTVNQKRLDSGGQLLVNGLIGNPDVVVKRFRTGEKMRYQGDRTIDEYWQALQDEHELAVKYFGQRFIPYTEFVIVEGTNFGDPYPEDFPLLPDKEYVMVQGKITGEEVETVLCMSVYPRTESLSRLKPEMIEFIKRYERMMRQEGKVIEDQVKINFTTGEIMIADTNHFYSFNEFVFQYGRSFLNAFAISPDSIRAPEDVVTILLNHVPAFSSLRQKGYISIRDINNGEFYPYFEKAQIELYRKYGPEVMKSFKDLVMALEYFAPEGAHNKFVQNLMTKFGITEAELDAVEDTAKLSQEIFVGSGQWMKSILSPAEYQYLLNSGLSERQIVTFLEFLEYIKTRAKESSETRSQINGLEKSLNSSEISHHLLNVEGPVHIDDPRHGAVHGTSIETIKVLLRNGILPGRQTQLEEMHYINGDLSVYPTPTLFSASPYIRHLLFPYGVDQVTNHPERLRKDAIAYAGTIAKSHRLLNLLKIPLSERALYISEISELLYDQDDRIDLQTFGIPREQIIQLRQSALSRKGFLLGISPRILTEQGMVIIEGDPADADIAIRTRGKGLSYDLITGIEPLGEQEAAFLRNLQSHS